MQIKGEKNFKFKKDGKSIINDVIKNVNNQ